MYTRNYRISRFFERTRVCVEKKQNKSVPTTSSWEKKKRKLMASLFWNWKLFLNKALSERRSKVKGRVTEY